MSRVFLFGEVDAGKSTLSAALAFYCFEADGVRPIFPATTNAEGSRLAQKWVKGLRAGSFPPKTERTTIQRVDFGYQDLKSGEYLGFSFLEASGEVIANINPLSEGYDERDQTLDDWINNADAIGLVAPSVPRSEDHRYEIMGFLQLLEELAIDKPTFLVLTKYDQQSSNPSAVGLVADEHYREIIKTLATYPKVSELFSFSIGNVDPNTGEIQEIDIDLGTHQLMLWLARVME